MWNDLITSYLLDHRAPDTYPNLDSVQSAVIKGDIVLVSFTYGDFRKEENYPIDLLDLMGYMWNNRVRGESYTI